jgi:hypothetical protein
MEKIPLKQKLNNIDHYRYNRDDVRQIGIDPEAYEKDNPLMMSRFGERVWSHLIWKHFGTTRVELTFSNLSRPQQIRQLLSEGKDLKDKDWNITRVHAVKYKKELIPNDSSE